MRLILVSIVLVVFGFGCSKVKLISADHPSLETAVTPEPTSTPVDQTPLPGVGIVAGGKVSTAAGIRVQSTVGEPNKVIIQRANGITVTSGVQGALVE